MTNDEEKAARFFPHPLEDPHWKARIRIATDRELELCVSLLGEAMRRRVPKAGARLRDAMRELTRREERRRNRDVISRAEWETGA